VPSSQNTAKVLDDSDCLSVRMRMLSMTNENKVGGFTRPTPNGGVYQTPSLKRKNGELPVDFMKRLNSLGYANGNLEKVTAHWNGDHSEYHFGSAKSCRLCRRASSQKSGGTRKSQSPVKLGEARKGSKGLTMVPFYLPSAFAELALSLPLGRVAVVIDVPSAKDLKSEAKSLDVSTAGKSAGAIAEDIEDHKRILTPQDTKSPGSKVLPAEVPKPSEPMPSKAEGVKNVSAVVSVSPPTPVLDEVKLKPVIKVGDRLVDQETGQASRLSKLIKDKSKVKKERAKKT